jgi:DNA-directed RNA polymerase specialized sigma24 family protein
MEKDCSHYFLSKTATEVWQNKDVRGQKQMYECCNAIQKPKFFRKVVFKNGKIHEERLLHIAEEIFIKSWEDFNLRGMSEGYEFKKSEYTNLLYTIFKRSYIKRLSWEMIRANAEQDFYKKTSEETTMSTGSEDIFSSRTQKALTEITPNCKQLLIWTFVDGLSYDEIAQRKNIARENCTKMVWACKKHFLKAWRKKSK